MKLNNFYWAFLAVALWVVAAASATAADPQAVTTRYVIKGNPHPLPARVIHFTMNYYSRDQAEIRFLPRTIPFDVSWWDTGLSETKEHSFYMASGTMMEYFWSEDVTPRVWRPSNPPTLPVIDGGSYDDPSRWIWVADKNIDTDIIFDKTPLKSEPHYYVVASLSNPAAFNNTYQWGLVGDTLGCSLSQQVRGSETVAIISGGKVNGHITVRAMQTGNPGRYVDRPLQVQVECENCSDCPTQADAANNSLDYTIHLGKGTFGSFDAVLNLKADAPSAALSTPSALKFYSATANGEALTTLGAPLQYKTPYVLAHVEATAQAPYEYTVKLYKSADVTKDTYLYTPNTGAQPFTTWTITNPDGATAQNRLHIKEERDGKTLWSKYTYTGSAGNYTWELLTENDMKKPTRSTLVTGSGVGSTTAETYQIIDKNVTPEVVRYQEINTATEYAWGKELTQTVVGTGANALTTSRVYYNNAGTDGNNYRRLKQISYPGGRWETFQYDQKGRPTRIVSQFKNNTLPNSTAEEDLNRVTTIAYFSSGDFTEEIKVKLNTQLVEHRFRKESRDPQYDYDFLEERVCTSVVETTTWSDPGNIVTKTWTYRPGFSAGPRPLKVAHPDGTFSIYSYVPSSTQLQIILKRGVPNPGQTDILDGEKTVTLLDLAGNLMSEETFEIANPPQNPERKLSSKVGQSPDPFGRMQTYTYLNNRTETYSYSCCSQTFADQVGVTTVTENDDYRRLKSVTKAEIKTEYDYDVTGRIWRTTRIGKNGSTIVLNKSSFDDAGRLVKSTNALGHVTTYSETVATRQKTTTFPNFATRIETYFGDGSLEKITGTAVHEVRYDYGADADGQWTQEIRVRAGSVAEWVKTYRDVAGRNYKTLYPDGAVNILTFDNKNFLLKSLDPDSVTNLFEYNAKGELTKAGIDLNNNGVLNPISDRLTETARTITTRQASPSATVLVRRVKTSVWSDSFINPYQISTDHDTAVDGSKSWVAQNFSPNIITTRAITYPLPRKLKVTETFPNQTTQETVYLDGQIESVTQKDSAGNQVGSATYVYDNHGRLQDVIDARNGTTSYAYYDDDRVNTITTPIPGFGDTTRQITTYQYNDLNTSGRIETITHHDGTKTTNEFHRTGELKKTSGSRTYTVEYTYEHGRVTTMKTWTNTAVATPATTTWTYTADRGFLQKKTYQDVGPGGKFTAYEYSKAGRLKKRTWARGVVTDYVYNAAGDVKEIDYSDIGVPGTPDVTFDYNPRGMLKTVVHPNGTHELAYHDGGSFEKEQHFGGVLNGLTVDPHYNNLLQQDYVSLTLATPIRHDYEYDTAGRMWKVFHGNTHVTYGYHANSALIQSATFRAAGEGGAVVMATTKNYDYLSRLKDISSVAISTLSHAYQYNAANQRSRDTLQDSSYWSYTYDFSGQVTNGIRSWSDNTPVAGQQFEYYYDHIGNRTKTRSGGDNYGIRRRTSTYTANLLNQYTSRTVPGSADVVGTAHADSTVTVDSAATQRKGDYYRADVPMDNSAGPKYQDVTVRGVRPNAGQDVMTTETRSLVLPPANQTFTYDFDGNLLTDGIWTYTWDAENRLKSMENTGAGNPPNASRKKLDFVYDYMGRRISKTVSTWNGSGFGTPVVTKFIYDRWNLLAELDSANNPIRSYMWGLDLSGTPQGAGGVGGLLAVTDSTGAHFPAYDGNGNIAALVKNDGTTSAQYEYGPFGQTIRLTGTIAQNNPFRFSTKFTDIESGFSYYGYRYYNPDAGRWLSRDPINEKAFRDLSSEYKKIQLQLGISDYIFARNNPVSWLDVLGLSEKDFDVITRQFVVVLKAMCKQKRCCPERGWVQNGEACLPNWLSPQQGCTKLTEDLQEAMYTTIHGGGLDDKWTMEPEQVTICWPYKHNYVVVKPVGGHDVGREIRLDLWKGCYAIRQFHSIPVPPFGYINYWTEDKHCFTCKDFQK